MSSRRHVVTSSVAFSLNNSTSSCRQSVPARDGGRSENSLPFRNKKKSPPPVVREWEKLEKDWKALILAGGAGPSAQRSDFRESIYKRFKEGLLDGKKGVKG